MDRMTNEQALRVLMEAGARLLRYWRIPDVEAPHVEAKDPVGFPDWSRISGGGSGASLDECVAWVSGHGATVEEYVRRVLEPRNAKLAEAGKPIRPAPVAVKPGLGLLPSSLGTLVVDIDLASKRALKTMKPPERQRRGIEGHKAVVAKLGEPDGVQRTPSLGVHCYYPADGIPESSTDNATWAIDDGTAKVGGEIRGTNGWVGVYDLPALAKMVQAGHGRALDLGTFTAFCSNPHRAVGARAYKRARASGGSSVQAACAAIRAAEAGDTYAGRNPTILYHVAKLANDRLLDDAAAAAVLDAVMDVKPEAIEDTERFIRKARVYFAASTGDTGGPGGVRGEGVARAAQAANGDFEAVEGADDDALVALMSRWTDWKDAVEARPPSSPSGLRREAPELLRQVMRALGLDGEPESDAVEVLDALQHARREARGDATEAVKAVLEARERRGIEAEPVEWRRDVAPREWLVPGWLPCGRIGMVTGKGEAGKSRLSLQLAAVLASGCGVWLPAKGTARAGYMELVSVPIGTGGQPVPVVVATWEDEADELVRRVQGMAELGIAPGRLERLFHVNLSAAGALWAPSKSGSGHVATLGALTGAGRWLRRHCERVGARLLVIDPLAAAYACSENDRGLVRHFMSDWDAWGLRVGCAVLLVSHPSRASLSDTDFFSSGSTDWHGASRFVWKMERESVGRKPKNGEDTRPKVMRLSVSKSNYLAGDKPGVWLDAAGAGWRAMSDEQAAGCEGSPKERKRGATSSQPWNDEEPI